LIRAQSLKFASSKPWNSCARCSEIETEALEASRSGGDVEHVVHRLLETRLAPAQKRLERALPQASLAFGQVLVGVAAGCATTGLGVWGGLVGAIPGAATSGESVVSNIRAGNRRRWIGAMQTIQSLRE